RASHLCTRSIGKEFNRRAPKSRFRGKHEEYEEREKRPKQQARGDGADSMQQPSAQLLYSVGARLLTGLLGNCNGELTFYGGALPARGLRRPPENCAIAGPL